MRLLRLQLAGYVVACTVVVTMAGCSVSPLNTLATARDLSSDLLIQFTVAADASNKAVMAEAATASATFADQAERAKSGVQANTEKLGSLLRENGYGEELELLNQFAAEFQRYRELDRQILDLTTENSNRKAEQLAYVQGQQAAESFQKSLKSLKPRSEGERWRVKALALEAIAAVREIVALQPLHIGEATDPRMLEIEKRMTAADAIARTAMTALEPALHESSRADFAAATASLDRFAATNTEVVALSRRNTNVRSRALTLTDKARLTSDCENHLVALRATLANRGSAATR